MASGLITSWEIDGETVETASDFILGGALKSLQIVTAAMKLKHAYSLEENLWSNFLAFWKAVTDFILWGSKITADGIAAMKLKHAYSLEGKLWPT